MRISKTTLLALWIAFCIPSFAQGVTFKYQGDPTGWQNLGPSGTWWRDQSFVSRLSLTPDQQKRMDDVFQQSRIKLIDLKATLDKEEAILDPMVKADRLDEIKVAAQIDKVADARAELEKANAKMLLGIRQVLTPEQWTKLNSSKFSWYSGSSLGVYKSKSGLEVLKQKQ
jgi:Spy/CpxP family protein refolding chaperone